MKFKIRAAEKFIKFMKIDIGKELFTKYDLLKGMNIELEHGYINKETNITNNDVILTGKIALAHLREFPDYYDRLEKLEKEATKYWENKE